MRNSKLHFRPHALVTALIVKPPAYSRYINWKTTCSCWLTIRVRPVPKRGTKGLRSPLEKYVGQSYM